MARRTDGEKIDELEKTVAALAERLLATTRALETELADHAGTAARLNDLHREFDREIALLKREVEELKKGQERWGQRLWMVLAPIIAEAAGVLIAAQFGLKK